MERTQYAGAQLPRWLLLLSTLSVALVVSALVAGAAERRDDRMLVELRDATDAIEMGVGPAAPFDVVAPRLLRAGRAFDAVAAVHEEAARHNPFGQLIDRAADRHTVPTPSEVAQLRESMLALAWDVSEIGVARERVTTLALLIGLLGTLLVAARAVALAQHIRRVEGGLRESEARLRRLSEFAFEGIAISDGGVIIDSNDALGELLGRTRDEMIGTRSVEFLDPSERERVAQIIASGGEAKYETRIRRGDGRIVPVEVRARTEMVSDRPLRVTVLRDISERKQLEAQRDRETEAFRNLSMVDDLTGLHNRRAFIELAEEEIGRIARTGRRAVLLFCDVDQLKPINDLHGHEEGDRALRDVARLLREVFRERDIVARLGGDEFVVLSTDVPDGAELGIRRRFSEALERFNSMPERRYALSISVGIAPCDAQSMKTIDELLTTADADMYVVKRARHEALRSNGDRVDTHG